MRSTYIFFLHYELILLSMKVDRYRRSHVEKGPHDKTMCDYISGKTDV